MFSFAIVAVGVTATRSPDPGPAAGVLRLHGVWKNRHQT